jgi:hypothetical protein
VVGGGVITRRVREVVDLQSFEAGFSPVWEF